MCIRDSFKAGGAAPEERVVLQDAARGRGGRPIHDADPHLPVVWRQLVRLPDRAPAPRPGTGSRTRGMDALELPRGASAGWSMIVPAWPERIVFGHAGGTQRSVRQTGI